MITARTTRRDSSAPRKSPGGPGHGPFSSWGVSSAKLILVTFSLEKTSITCISSEYFRSGSTLIRAWSNGRVGSLRIDLELLLECVHPLDVALAQGDPAEGPPVAGAEDRGQGPQAGGEFVARRRSRGGRLASIASPAARGAGS